MPDPVDPAKVSPEDYQRMVEAFYTGVIAIEVGDGERGLTSLTAATEILPGEPAAWADLALAHLRNNQLEPAAAALARARHLAPEHSEVALLAGFLAQRQNDLEGAEALFREAIAQDGGNLRAQYALYDSLKQRGGAADPQRLAEMRSRLSAIAASRPANPVPWLEMAALASEEALATEGEDAASEGASDGQDSTGEGAAEGGAGANAGAGEAGMDEGADLSLALTSLQELSAAWPEAARAQLTSAIGLAGDPAATARDRQVAVITLRNLLLPSLDFKTGIAELQSDFGSVAPPIDRFIRLPSPSPLPAEADRALSFTAQPIEGAGALWAKAFWRQGEGLPSILVAFEDRLELRDAATEATSSDAGESTGVDSAEAMLLDPPAGELSPAGALAIDWNNDLRMDLALAGAGGLRLYEQAEDGGFVDRSDSMGLPAGVLVGDYRGAWAVDLDLEGDLDLILGAANGAPTVLRNNGDGSFAPIDPNPLADLIGPAELVWADLDGDGDADLAALQPDGQVLCYENRRALGYLRHPLAEGSMPTQALGMAVADLPVDGRLDLLVSTVGGGLRSIAHGPEAGGWSHAGVILGEDAPTAESSASAGPSEDADLALRALLAGDLDNNGAFDLVGGELPGGDRPAGGAIQLGGAALALSALETAPPAIEPISLVDLDGDGKLDILGLDASGAPIRLMNQGGALVYHWQVLRPRAVTVESSDQRNNSVGLGGEIELRAGLLHQKVLIDGPVIHLGLGENPKTNVARIRWPHGGAQGEFELLADQSLLAEQRLVGSCPWLFAWNGERMDFVTDVLWRSPLGLRINAQDTAGVVQTRDWVRVRGDQLQAKDGRYDLRVTAELWETHFFDEVKLRVIDHPAGTEAWVDERFSFPPPPLAVQLTGPVLPVTRALDPAGVDVTELVATRDGRHHEAIGRGQYQGIAGDHWIELELDPTALLEGTVESGRVGLYENEAQRVDEVARTGQLLLIAQGWVYPTDSSLNVAIGQGQTTPPIDLSLEAQTPDGSWTVLREHLGFPAGKRKSLLIDLSGLAEAVEESDGSKTEAGAVTKPWRIRLRTTMEIRWDALGIARALPDLEPTSQELTPSQAELRYRGFSQTNRLDGSARVSEPEIPDYDRLTATRPIWLDLEGFYTRFGDIRELLETTDDRYAILNAGDEMVFSFDAPEAPAAGLVRDFVFISDGWVKDGNLNTSYSETVAPLPAHDRPEYTLPGVSGPLGPLSEDPVYRAHAEDWQRFHTRYVSPWQFQQSLRPSDIQGKE
jgi:tetratricopeptide (TPR) repeat protein